MKRLFTICTALAASLLATHVGAAAPNDYPADTLAAYFDDAPEPAMADEAKEEKDEEADSKEAKSSCGCESEASDCASGCSEEASCCCEPSCGCSNGCGSSCGGDSGFNCFGDCCLGDAWTLQSELCPCEKETTYGGWLQFGYHSDLTGQSSQRGDLFDFNDVPDNLNLQQAWFYTEKATEADACSPDWGYRFDMLYGTDAQKTQAFGNSGAGSADGPQGWDNEWDHGVYGWAIPQAYAEVAYGDWKVKIGHFFTLVGYEVIPATGNFFYSHSLTMFNSEPFTHTGVLGAYEASDKTTYHVGWVLGWDTGYDQFGDGNALHSGVIHQATDDISISYMNTVGNLGFRSGDEFGYSHSIVAITDLSEKMKYVFQSDLVDTEGSFGDPDAPGHDVGVNQYLLYTLNDCWGVGGRIEWWKSNTSNYNPGESTSYYELTGGINYKPHANVVVRPEVRYDWSPTDLADYNREIFGIDVILTY